MLQSFVLELERSYQGFLLAIDGLLLLETTTEDFNFLVQLVNDCGLLGKTLACRLQSLYLNVFFIFAKERLIQLSLKFLRLCDFSHRWGRWLLANAR